MSAQPSRPPSSTSNKSALEEIKPEGADVPEEQKAGWASFIKSLARMTGDLSSMTAPPFILSPTSLTEFPAYWCEHPAAFASISEGKDQFDRSERSRNEKMGSEKKPLNPVLGELFYGVWPDENGRGETKLVVEQVSHHPPITAYYIENVKAGVKLQGHSGQKTSFTGTSINVKQSGHAILTVKPKNGDPQEKYLITLRMSFSPPSSSTGYTAQIDYKGKGYFSGKAHSFKATITKSGKILQSYEGQWTGNSYIGKKNGHLFLDMNEAKEEVTVKPIEEQGEWESRKLWEKVAKGIRSQNYDEAGREKSRIENEQRQRRKDEAAAGITWQHVHFTHVDSDEEYQSLAELLHDKLTPAHEDAYVFKANI
ncbi:oxysterol binding protein [Cryptococcus deuterogattii 99/473]|uniref:Oxysterol binding protein n=1 Tax=Cryptococcus deuterogattii Ram5 TaxID=1296110 RepID=A0A0D0URR0_9TREE|nr:oxysterol binding protein [Cryptococcus deuterogattii Ram5]KIY56766.1 oxysterol binding protein [Cryptococcus deuterogattii 99/473]